MAGILWPQDKEKSKSGSNTLLPQRRASSGGMVEELCKAAQRGDLNQINKLIDGSARVNPNGNQPGRIPIVHAAAKNQWKALRLLLEKRAKPNLLNSNGQSALHVAAERFQNDHSNLEREHPI